MPAQLDKAVPFVVFTSHACLHTVRALIPAFDQGKNGDVQTNTSVLMCSRHRCVK